MRFLEMVPEDAVVTAFLRAELQSPRFASRLLDELEGCDPANVFTREPEFRRELLARHRGWGRGEGLFDGFPEEVEWHRVAATPDEVLDIRFINWDWCLTLSDGTRDARIAADRIRRNLAPGVGMQSHKPLAEALGSAKPPPELIALSPPERAPIVLVEGHWRLTAYALFPQYLPRELELFLGIAERARDWSEF